MKGLNAAKRKSIKGVKSVSAKISEVDPSWGHVMLRC